MTAITGLLVRVLAGMGIAWGFDKVLPAQVPNYQPITPFASTMKTIITIVALVAGGFLVTFLARKLKIKI